MLGAIIGDIAGSRFERRAARIKTTKFTFFHPDCHLTDDSVLTLAVAEALLLCKGDFNNLAKQAFITLRRWGQRYPACGFGSAFKTWLFKPEQEAKPYQSFGNGSAMRVSACGFAAGSLEEAAELSASVTKVTHSHPEGMKGAEATAAAVYLARTGRTVTEIKEYIDRHYYRVDFRLDEIRGSYRSDLSCQGSVPQALEAFYESEDFEDTIRNAISVGGDSDTIAAIAGGIAEAHYGIPADIREQAMNFLDHTELSILREFEDTFQSLAPDSAFHTGGAYFDNSRPK